MFLSVTPTVSGDERVSKRREDPFGAPELEQNRRTLVVNLRPQVFPQPRLVLSEIVFEQIEEALVGVFRHGRVTQDEGAVLDERFGGLQGARGSANKLTPGAKACALRRPARVDARFRAMH